MDDNREPAGSWVRRGLIGCAVFWSSWIAARVGSEISLYSVPPRISNHRKLLWSKAMVGNVATPKWTWQMFTTLRGLLLIISALAIFAAPERTEARRNSSSPLRLGETRLIAGPPLAKA